MVLMVRLASGANVTVLFFGGRLVAPTGYINSTAALFTIDALVCIVLASWRRLAGPVRGLLVAFAAVSLQLATIVQSRGWLFTLPLIALVAIVIVPDRLRVAGAAVIPVIAALIPVRRLLHVYQSGPSDPLRALAIHAGRPALAMCVGAFVIGTLAAWADSLYRGPGLGRAQRRAVGTVLAIIGVAGVLAGGLAVSKGHPFQFISRQWHGFAHAEAVYGSSHFTDVGSGRYDYWRVALHAFEHHPIGGLGQDNFGDYYLTLRHTGEEPSWTHSLELRLLAHTGIVGFLLFGGFLVAAIMAAARTRRHGDADTRLLAAALLLPLVVWLIHGSIDWFWEVPALSGPALGFLGAAGGLGTALGVAPGPAGAPAVPGARPRSPRNASGAGRDAPAARRDARGLPRGPHSPPASARSGPDRHRPRRPGLPHRRPGLPLPLRPRGPGRLTCLRHQQLGRPRRSPAGGQAQPAQLRSGTPGRRHRAAKWPMDTRLAPVPQLALGRARRVVLVAGRRPGGVSAGRARAGPSGLRRRQAHQRPSTGRSGRPAARLQQDLR